MPIPRSLSFLANTKAAVSAAFLIQTATVLAQQTSKTKSNDSVSPLVLALVGFLIMGSLIKCARKLAISHPGPVYLPTTLSYGSFYNDNKGAQTQKSGDSHTCQSVCHVL